MRVDSLYSNLFSAFDIGLALQERVEQVIYRISEPFRRHINLSYHQSKGKQVLATTLMNRVVYQ